MKFTVFLLAPALACAAPLAAAATFNVTQLGDGGAGSLRAAVADANAAAGADTIRFAAGLGGTVALASEIAITDALDVIGPGAGHLVIDGATSTRLFRIAGSGDAITVRFSGLTLAHGHASDEGGAIWSSGDHVVVDDCILDGNMANTRGGAIFVAGANLTVTGSRIANSESGSTGGAILLSAGDLDIRRSVIEANASEFGGGVTALSPGVNVSISDSTFRANSADHTGGGLWASTVTSLHIARSAFVGNSTGQPNGGGAYIAAITDFGAPTNVIENSTFSANVSLHQSGRGSAVALASGNLTVRNSTFAFNRTSPDTSGGTGVGGALWVAGGETTRVTLQSTLFAGNTHGSQNTPIDLYRDVGGGAQSRIDADHCAFQTWPDVTILDGTVASTLFDTDPELEPLDEHGATPVHPLPATSPAVDHGANPANLTTDQRGTGHPRTAQSSEGGATATDIGAYEYRVDRIFADGFDPR